jgi:hypothetical protein
MSNWKQKALRMFSRGRGVYNKASELQDKAERIQEYVKTGHDLLNSDTRSETAMRLILKGLLSFASQIAAET